MWNVQVRLDQQGLGWYQAPQSGKPGSVRVPDEPSSCWSVWKGSGPNPRLQQLFSFVSHYRRFLRLSLHFLKTAVILRLIFSSSVYGEKTSPSIFSPPSREDAAVFAALKFSHQLFIWQKTREVLVKMNTKYRTYSRFKWVFYIQSKIPEFINMVCETNNWDIKNIIFICIIVCVLWSSVWFILPSNKQVRVCNY